MTQGDSDAASIDAATEAGARAESDAGSSESVTVPAESASVDPDTASVDPGTASADTGTASADSSTASADTDTASADPDTASADTGEDPVDSAGVSVDDAAASGFGAQFRGQRAALLVLGTIGAILIGFAIGVLARQPLERNAGPDPNATDIGFSQDMSEHHAQAVEMAAVAVMRSTNNDVRRLAYDILLTQQGQIGAMQGWLQLWGKPLQGVDGFMGWMTDTGGGHHGSATTAATHTGPMATMPGMATPAELATLRQAPTAELDTLFLQLMLRHHQGGLTMINYAADHAQTTAIRSLADTMARTQQNEAQLITSMLTTRGATPLPLN